MNGILVVDKPNGLTSHDVVDIVRDKFDIKKVGHLGTLDPMATGVLPLSIGRATRLARFIASSPKEYTGRIRFGWATTTCDKEGDVLGKVQRPNLSNEDVVPAMRGLTGPQKQIPPAYSAKKLSGIPAYKLARSGMVVRLKPISVEVHAFDLISLQMPYLEFKVICTGGTFIRSLARDLGEKLGTGAHLDALRRSRSGPFILEQAVTIDQISGNEIIPPEELLTDLDRIEVDSQEQESIRHGRSVACSVKGPNARIFNKKSQLIAIAIIEKGWAHPKVVLI